MTSIGDDNLLMAYAHVAHDCHVESHTVLANGVTLGGHVTIANYARIGAFTGVHQFCRIGRHAMIGGYCVITQDVAPFSLTSTTRDPKVYGPNKIGLERHDFPAETIQGLHKAFRLLGSKDLNTTQALERIRTDVAGTAEVTELVEFIVQSERGVIK